jgi:O-acetylserine/cysteine efflux transporter
MLAMTVAVLWGANFVVMKHIVSEMPPLTVTGIRFTMAAVPLIFFVPRPKVSWRGLLGFGLAFGVVKFGLLFTAFKAGMPAGLAAIVLQLQALFTILLAVIVLGERPRAVQWLGIGLALGGALVIVAARLDQRAAVVPILLTLAAAGAWAVANILMKREGTFDPVGFTVWSSLFPGLVMLGLAGWLEGPAAISAAVLGLSGKGIAALLYLAYVISILSGAMWAYLFARHSAAVVAPFALLVPVVALAAASGAYGEQPDGASLIGGGLIIAGLAVNVFSGRARVTP